MSSKISIVMAIGSLLLAGVGCASSSDDQNGGKDQLSAEPTEGEGTDPEYSVGCHGEVSPLGTRIGGALGAKCVGGDPGTKGCQDQQDPCAPQRVSFSYVQPAMRCGTFVFSWDGTACVSHATSGVDGSLRCAGEDCPQLYLDEAACTSAHTACTGS